MGIGNNHDGVTRRQVVGAAIVALAMPGIAQAGGGGGREADDKSSKKSKSNTTKSRKLDVVYTQRNLRKVSNEDLRIALEANRKGQSVVVSGFSKRMSSNLFEMMLIDRQLTETLVNQLRRVDSVFSKGIVLKQVEENVTTEINTSQGQQATSLFTQNDDLKDKKRYRKLLRYWVRNPQEGDLF
ncbi:hypothetical protein [Roseovarius sp. 2305UL8-3]|uniref:hypothetical protein n=1 Tax=Roseovarius conchicola TaxID=3121636 RepID=UPI003527773F